MDIKEIFYDWGGYNTKIFYAINSIHGELYQKFMLFGTSLGYYKMFFIYFPCLLLIAYFSTRIQKKSLAKTEYNSFCDRWKLSLLTLLLSYIFSLGWVSQLKHYFHFARPFVRLPEGSVNVADSIKLSESPMASFPSGHSSFAMMMVVGLWPILNLPGRIIACFYLVWVGISRIALGAHFPADVCISFIIAFSFAYLARRIAQVVLIKIKQRA